MNQVYFGPVKPQASWQWVGADVARALADRLSVRYFDGIADLPHGAIVFWIKDPGSDLVAEEVERKRLTLLFFPVDCFIDEAHIARHRRFIDAASLICLHAHSLAPFFSGRPIAYVDHYNKYGVRAADRRPGDTLLWIGTYQYLPYVLSGLLALGRRLPNVLLLTNLDAPRARVVALENAARVGLPDLDACLASGLVEIRQWTEASQRAALLTCRAAFDIKYLPDFNQRHKPPTKLQKYLCSGIPCAANDGVPYLAQLPDVVDRLDDLMAAAPALDCAEELSRQLALDQVAAAYVELAQYAIHSRVEKVPEKTANLSIFPYSLR